MSKVEIAGVDTSTLPKISNAEQLIMLTQIKSGDNTARQQFIFANMRLVLSVIQKYINKKSSMDDVFQVGCVGLIKAIDNFDAKFGVQFSTYAVPMIIGEIRRHLRDNNSLRVSRSMRDIAYRALVAKEEILKTTEREPSVDEIAVKLDVPYRSVYFALNATSNMVSLDDVVADDGSKDIIMLEKIDAGSTGADDWLEDVMLKKAINLLSEREREILSMRYFEGKTQVEVSNEVGISQAQVSRLEKTALDGIKKRM
jgi:RNA polymerase sporulation-specific sigma factor